VVFVLKDGVEVSVHANTIGEHLLLVVEEGIGAEVIGVVNVFGDRGASTTWDSVCRGSHVTHTRPSALALSAPFNF